MCGREQYDEASKSQSATVGFRGGGRVSPALDRIKMAEIINFAVK